MFWNTSNTNLQVQKLLNAISTHNRFALFPVVNHLIMTLTENNGQDLLPYVSLVAKTAGFIVSCKYRFKIQHLTLTLTIMTFYPPDSHPCFAVLQLHQGVATTRWGGPRRTRLQGMLGSILNKRKNKKNYNFITWRTPIWL